LIKAITFDMWNTLIQDKHYGDLRVKFLAEALSRMGVSRSYHEIREAYLSTHSYVHKVWRDENYRFVPAEQRLSHILERLGADLTEDLKLETLKNFQHYPLGDPPGLAEDAHETLECLSSRFKLGIICDSGYTPGRVLRAVLARHKVLEFFEATMFSDENGFNKPHGTMFKKALSSLETEPSEAVHVGDLLLTDIAGAKAAGMKAVWLNNEGQANIGPFKPDYEIRALPEIISILNEM
jgi:putative hydrolase of the HAD superfamily